MVSLLVEVFDDLGNAVKRVHLQVMDTFNNTRLKVAVSQAGLVELAFDDGVDIRQDAVLEVGARHQRVLREVQQERHDLADLLNVELVLEEVVHPVEQELLLLDHRVGYLLQGQQHHVNIRLSQESIDVEEELRADTFLELGMDILIAAKNEAEHDIIELVEHKEAQQVLVLGQVPQEVDDELEEGAHGEVARHAHNLVLHQMDDLCEALEELKGGPRAVLGPERLLGAQDN